MIFRNFSSTNSGESCETLAKHKSIFENEKCEIWRKCMTTVERFFEFGAVQKLASNWKSGAKVCESCRSRQELSYEYMLAKIGVDAAENRPLKVCLKLAKVRTNIGRAPPADAASADDAAARPPRAAAAVPGRLPLDAPLRRRRARAELVEREAHGWVPRAPVPRVCPRHIWI